MLSTLERSKMRLIVENTGILSRYAGSRSTTGQQFPRTLGLEDEVSEVGAGATQLELLDLCIGRASRTTLRVGAPPRSVVQQPRCLGDT